MSELLLLEVFKDKVGIVYDKNIIRSIIEMLIQMGLGSNSVYREIFEEKYLAKSLEFYQEEAGKLIEELKVSEYLKHADKRLQQEIKMCVEVIDASTQDKILKIIDKCFIETYSSQILENKNFFHMIENEEFETLKLLYTLFLRSKCIQELANSLSEYIKTILSSILSDQINIKKPINTIELILKVIDRVNKTVNDCFCKNSFLETSAKISFETSINTSNRIAIYFAIYLDTFLTKDIKFISDNDIENQVIRFMKLFLFIKCKDVFEIKHKEFLASRLLEGKSLNIDGEKIIIKYLKQECGLNYVNKMEGMITDMSVNESISPKENFSARVLTDCYWPKEKHLQISLPSVLGNECSEYVSLYNAAHNGRRLI